MSIKVNGTHATIGRTKHARGHAHAPVERARASTAATEGPRLRHVATTARVVAPPSAFPHIADYAFLSDCETNAHIAPNGNLEWMCLPRPDQASVFAAMLDRDAGHFRIGPADRKVPMSRAYVPGTMVVETTWQTPTGWLVVRDALCMTPWYQRDERCNRFRRAPPDWEAAGMLVRTVECTRGRVDVELDCAPFFEYGKVPAKWVYSGPGYGETIATGDGTTQRLVLSTNLRLGIDRRRAHTRTVLQEGERAFAALAWGDLAPPKTNDEAQARINETINYWQGWLERGTFPDHPWRSYLQRSALTIKGLTYAPTGALLAAATTSLPETPGGSRNWDYRFTWLRDSVFTLASLTELGFEAEAWDYTLFLAETVDPKDGLQIMYGIGGETNLDEHVLDHLAGYEGARPVRIGNGAYDQKQHDVWGNVIALLYLQSATLSHFPTAAWNAVKTMMETMSANWEQADRGIWEVRGDPKHFVSSKVMCWVAADRATRLALLRGEPEYAAKWQSLAEEISAEICTKGLDERGVFTQFYGSTGLDASNLLMALFRFLPGTDERLRATVLAIADELTVDGLVLRYRTGETDDGLAGEEGTFCICSFWLVSSLVYVGEVARARKLAEKLLTFASPIGLYAEEIDATSGRHLGNFPQAFSHLSLIDALLKVIGAEELERKASDPRELPLARMEPRS